MKWFRWALVGIAGIAAATVIGLYPFNEKAPQQAAEQTKPVPGPKEEQRLKQMMLHRDMTATERLIRMDTKGHLRALSEASRKIHTDKLKSRVTELQKGHQQFKSILWYDSANGKTKEIRAAHYKANPEEQKQIASYISFAKKSLQKGKSYESPAFPQKDPKFYITAEPAKQGGNGVIAVMDLGILGKVKEHQHKNLRLIPYPKEGKYKVESVETDTLRDITVKTGHDNEKASHYYENEIVVTFKHGLSTEDRKKIMNDLHCKPPQKIVNTYIFRSDKLTMNELKDYFLKNWQPDYVEPHYLYMTNETSLDDTPLIPNDMLFSEYQWNLPIIDTTRGWKLSKGTNDVIVGVVDTGVDLQHPDLKGRLLKGYNVDAPDEDPIDDVGHGTHVAGIIAANTNNSEGIAGMMWSGKILPVKALDKSGAGTTYSVAQGIIWATDNGAKVINMSLGNYADAKFLHEAVKYAFDHDVVLVAATGNDNTERPGYPAAYPEVLSVSATDYNLKKASFSNYGDYVDVMAPGESIASTYPDNQYAALSGTSMACPHVTALAALIRSINPELKNTEVMDIIRKNVIDLGTAGHDKYYGYGQIDVYAALEAAGGGDASLQFWPQAIERKMDRAIERLK
ncbi:peptidase S8 [Paenibacillus sp. 79R4]|uniref:S8 family peptidase n=1 Tax=Paenibacillus sp. 79R4 TaxID=2212847 RepID=UPI0015BC29FE|nr:S8 family peptidase [Paenibacillus sp. 79R4]NWL86847.1 peptidase S8 [Paenibacillus sp. 79R4]